jgi:MFS transporter, ACS family, pantothenate transporter
MRIERAECLFLDLITAELFGSTPMVPFAGRMRSYLMPRFYKPALVANEGDTLEPLLPLEPSSSRTSETMVSPTAGKGKARRPWRSYIWYLHISIKLRFCRIYHLTRDTWDKSPEERRFLGKLDACLLTYAALSYFSKYLDQQNVTVSYNC